MKFLFLVLTWWWGWSGVGGGGGEFGEKKKEMEMLSELTLEKANLGRPRCPVSHHRTFAYALSLLEVTAALTGPLFYSFRFILSITPDLPGPPNRAHSLFQPSPRVSSVSLSICGFSSHCQLLRCFLNSGEKILEWEVSLTPPPHSSSP